MKHINNSGAYLDERPRRQKRSKDQVPMIVHFEARDALRQYGKDNDITYTKSIFKLLAKDKALNEALPDESSVLDIYDKLSEDNKRGAKAILQTLLNAQERRA
jgi:hypothetical protein